jgi:hypothetical protein
MVIHPVVTVVDTDVANSVPGYPFPLSEYTPMVTDPAAVDT